MRGVKNIESYTFLFFLLFVGQPLSAQLNSPQDILKEGREKAISGGIDSTRLAAIFNTARFAITPDDQNDVNQYVIGDDVDEILTDLIKAEYLLKGPTKNGSAAYQLYLSALDNSLSLGDSILICESLKRILNFYVFTIKDRETFNEFLSMHKVYAYDRIEEIYNSYFEIRASYQYATAEDKKITIPQTKWTNLIEECASSRYYRLETELRSIHGVYLEIQEEDIAGAKEAYESSILSAQNLDSTTYQRIQFAALANIGAMYQSIKEPYQSLDYLKRALSLRLTGQKPENQVYIYNWMSQVYRDIDQQDSAFHYLKKAYDINQKYELSKHNIAVEEIQEKYQNEALKVDLMNTQLTKGRYALLIWIMSGVLIIGTVVYLLYARISRLTKMNLEQKIENVEQESQLKAINAKFDGEEAERRRVASVLHDDISTHLAASRLHLGAYKRQSNTEDVSIQKTDALLADISVKVRELSHELYPPSLYQLGLMESLKGLVEKYSTKNLRFQIEGGSHPLDTSQDQNVKLYYVIHELIHNVIKHSEASTCTINLDRTKSDLIITVTDNGIGGINIDNEKSNSLGLYSIKARVENMSGHVSIDSPIGKGTSIRITAPLSSNAPM